MKTTLDEQLQKVIADGEALAVLAEQAAAIAKDLGLDDRCNTITDLAARGRNRSFQIIFAGEFNSGKSTAINALLGEPVMPMHVLEANAILTRIRYGPQKRAVLYPAAGGTPQEFPYEKFAQQIVVDSNDRKKPNPWKSADLYYPVDILKHGIVVVDPPGTNALPERQELTMREAANSDAAVFLFFATQAFKETEHSFIVSCLDGKDTFWLVTHADYLKPKDATDLREFLERQLREIRPQDNTISSRIFFVDAQHAQEAAAQQNHSDFAASGMKEFFDALGHFISGDRHRAKMRSMCVEFGVNLAALDQAAESQRLDSERKHDDVVRRRAKLKTELEAVARDTDSAVERLTNRIFPLTDTVRRTVRAKTRGLPANLPFRNSDIALSEVPSLRMAMGFDQEKRQRIIDSIRRQVVRMIQEDLRYWFRHEVSRGIKADLDTELEKFDHAREVLAERLATIRNEYLGLPPSRAGHKPAAPDLQANQFTDVISQTIHSVTGAMQVPTPGVGQVFQTWANTPYGDSGAGTWTDAKNKANQEFAGRIARLVVEQVADMADDLAEEAHDDMRSWVMRVEAAAVKSISDPRIDLEKTAQEGERTSRLEAQEKQARRGQLIAHRTALSALGQELAVLHTRYATP
jgi:hypothetical protein